MRNRMSLSVNAVESIVAADDANLTEEERKTRAGTVCEVHCPMRSTTTYDLEGHATVVVAPKPLFYYTGNLHLNRVAEEASGRANITCSDQGDWTVMRPGTDPRDSANALNPLAFRSVKSNVSHFFSSFFLSLFFFSSLSFLLKSQVIPVFFKNYK